MFKVKLNHLSVRDSQSRYREKIPQLAVPHKFMPVKETPLRETHQALDNLQQLFHDHCNALVAQQPADDLKVWRSHKVPVAAINAGVGKVQSLGKRGQFSTWSLGTCR